MVAAALSFWLYSLQPSQGSQGQVPDPVALPLTGHCPGLGVSVWRVGLLDPVAGPSPLMLATTRGIIVYFLFLQVLRCFSSLGLPSSIDE